MSKKIKEFKSLDYKNNFQSRTGEIRILKLKVQNLEIEKWSFEIH
jgi:hypothetical protein